MHAAVKGSNVKLQCPDAKKTIQANLTMEKQNSTEKSDVAKVIATDRERTNILRSMEQKTIAFLVQRIPSWISSDMLTAIGFTGNIIVSLSFVLAAYFNPLWLFLGISGFMISWFGDSLDGRLAYYRNTPRKWYGFSLDLTTDWLGTFLIGLGFVLYAEGLAKLLGLVFVVFYGWEIMTTLIRYKITGKYSIDSGLIGPTEVRVLISIIMVIEVLFRGSITWFAVLACLILFVFNILDSRKLLKLATVRDNEERKKSAESPDTQT